MQAPLYRAHPLSETNFWPLVGQGLCLVHFARVGDERPGLLKTLAERMGEQVRIGTCCLDENSHLAGIFAADHEPVFILFKDGCELARFLAETSLKGLLGALRAQGITFKQNRDE